MKVFVSWSGPRSHAVAQVLREWVMAVIQAARPWLSSEDIQRGAQWFGDIGSQLQESSVGIFCLTQRNKTAPWILFEAGAIAKGVPTNRICTLLIDLEPTDVLGPLAQFNHTRPTRDEMYKLAATLNSALGETRLTEAQLKKSFDAHWESFDEDFRAAVDENPEAGAPVAPPATDEMLGEILSNLRSMNSRLSQIEASATADVTEAFVRAAKAATANRPPWLKDDGLPRLEPVDISQPEKKSILIRRRPITGVGGMDPSQS
ncbi:hypothetical protein M2282_003285 [Variovorax boronicumulans]|uniref:toll/interleukin-1 receptor domain-containing protein n=1 Tax=Variovorax boronicumulans TaxID=436515 RepID=UPI0024766A99|nr:toll/interleukin-1 receptor domain-containing protein [Variovorax boronicumulans]MDH6168134.1 hypothetical protein [Variovorax boronicumulans]